MKNCTPCGDFKYDLDVPSTGGGGSVNSFETINTPNGTDPVADSATDTLNLTSSDSTITITGDSSTDTVDYIARVATSGQSGIVSTTTQTFAGRKTFAGSVVLSANLNISWTQDNTATGSNATLTNHPTVGVELTNASLVSISKIDSTSTSQGHMVLVRNLTGNPITIVNDVDNSGDEIFTGLGANAVLPNEESVWFIRDRTGLYWVMSGQTGDHGALVGLSDDDHTQYLLLAGRSGGQVATGGTGSGDDLTLRSTSNATKGTVFICDDGGTTQIGVSSSESLTVYEDPDTSGAKVSVQTESALTGTSVARGITAFLGVDPPADTTAAFLGIEFGVELGSPFDYNSAFGVVAFGLNGYVDFTGSGDVNGFIAGAATQANITGGGTADFVAGLQASITVSNGSTVDEAAGANSSITCEGGTIGLGISLNATEPLEDGGTITSRQAIRCQGTWGATAQTLTDTGNIDAFNPTNSYVYATGAAPVLRGIEEGMDGKILEFDFVNAATIANESGSVGTAANRITTKSGADLTSVIYAKLVYNSTTSRWRVEDFRTTNAAQFSFSTIDVPNGTDPVADAGSDTLTLEADGGTTSANADSLIITGDSSTDTINFSVRYNNPDTGANSERFGDGSSAAFDNATAFGNTAICADEDSVAVGRDCQSDLGCVTVGYFAYGANSSGPGFGSVAVGAAATSNDGGVAIGDTAQGASGVAIGLAADSSGGGVAIGNGASATGANSFSIGFLASCASINGLAMGTQASIGTSAVRNVTIGTSTSIANSVNDNLVMGASASSSFSQCIALGASATPTATGQCLIGGSNAGSTTGTHITSVFIGKGVTNSTPATEILITATGETGTNEAGSRLVLQPGRSTGSYASTAGNFVVRTGVVGSSGTTAQTQEDRMTIYVGGNVVFNENSVDQDFRIESNNDANCFFVDGGTDQVGIGDATPVVKLDVNGGLALQSSGSAVNLTADNQNVNAGDRSHVILSSDNATPANRTFTLSNGLGDGQILILEWSGTNAGEIVAATNIKLSATWTPTQYDTLQLMWSANASAWLELSRSANA